MPVKKHEVVRTSYQGISGPLITTSVESSDLQFNNLTSDGEQKKPWFEIRNHDGLDSDVTRIYQNDGKVVFIFGSSSDLSTLSLVNKSGLIELSNESIINTKLEIGETHVYRTKVSKSEFVRYQHDAKGFLSTISFFNFDGTRAQEQNLLADIYYANAAEYIVTVACVGNGGSGTYELGRKTVVPTKLELNEVVLTDWTRQNELYFSINLEANKPYELLFEGRYEPELVVLDENGTPSRLQRLDTDMHQLFYFTAATTGVHRICISSHTYSKRFKIRIHKPLSIDDGSKTR